MDQTYGPTMMPGPPGMEAPPPPGWVGMTPQAFGVGGPKFGPQAGVQGMQQAQAQAGSMFGGGVMNAAAGAAHTAYQVTSFGAMTVAPLLATFGSTMAIRGVGSAWAMTDPFQVGLAGARGGWAMAGASNLGMGGKLALGGAMGLGAGAAMYAPVAVAQSWVEHSLKGARDAMLGRSTLQGTSVGGREGVSAGQGAMFGRDLASLSSEMGTSTDELASLTKQLDQMKVFQSTRNVSEFRSKFKEVLGAIKEIAKTTKQTLEDATQTFGELKQQGFYSTADITAQAAKRSAQSKMSGVDDATLGAYGGMGAQMARSMGMRGKYGADFMSSSVSSMATAYRGMSDHQQMIVDEHGGAEEMGASLAAKQMRFLSSARGRVMIANSMGADGGPSAAGLGRILGGGQTTESLVQGAAGSGLGTLMQAGSARTKEQYLPYAGMMQLMMAQSQAKQLWGGSSQRGLETMMGTMGMSRDETQILVAQTMQMPKILQQQAAEQTTAMQQADYTTRRKQSSWSSRASQWAGGYTTPWEEAGGRGMARLSASYEATANELVGYHEGTVGEAGRKRLRDTGASTLSKLAGERVGDRYEAPSLFGPTGERESILREYGGYTQTVRKGTNGKYYNDNGTVTPDKGDSFVELTGGGTTDHISVISRKRLEQAQRVASEAAIPMEKQLQGRLDDLVAGTYFDKSLSSTSNGMIIRGLDKWLGGSKSAGLGYGFANSNTDEWALGEYIGEGPDKLSPEEARGYAAMKRMNMPGVPRDVREFIKMKSENSDGFTRLYKTLGDGLRKSGMPDEKIRATAGNKAIAGNSLTREGAQTRLKTSLEKVSGITTEMSTAISGDSEKAVAFDAYVKTLGGNDAAARSEARRAAKAAGINTDSIDNLSVGEQKSLREQWEKQGVSENITLDIGAKAYGAKADQTSAALAKRDLLLREKPELRQSDSVEAALGNLRSAGEDPLRRKSAFGSLFLQLADGDITSEEKELLTSATGDSGQTAGIAGELGWLTSTGKKNDKRRSAALEALGMGGQESGLAAALGDSKGDDRLKKAIKYAMDNGGAIDNAQHGVSKDKTVQGSETEYVEANTRFVTAVTSFVTQLKASYPDIKLDDTVPK